MSDIFFIIGCSRSGTTAYAQILNTAANAEVYVEQPPKLLVESRRVIKGNLVDPLSVIQRAKNEIIQVTLGRGLKYGDKNSCYMPLIPYLYQAWKCKIIFLIRDGRAVVRSMIDWYREYKNIFAMHEDDNSSILTDPENDPWDYSRLRPNPGAPLFYRWEQLSRFEKFAWYWANFNAMALENLSRVDGSKWMIVDMSDSSVRQVEQVFQFLDLTGFDAKTVETMLNANINSLFDKIGTMDRFPEWPDWAIEQKHIFREYAGSMMVKLGYW